MGYEALVTNRPYTDEELLSRLLDDRYADALSDKEREVFSSMRAGSTLSAPQRNWVRSVAERLGIQVAPSRNEFSALSKEKKQEHLKRVRTQLPWEKPGYVKAVKPPGRS